jgi:5-carboxymethyl-2-hydroxymuconate isomerase
MPQLILEYTDNLKERMDFPVLFADLHQILVVVALASLDSCKSRAVKHEQYYVGDGNIRNAFVHVEVLLAEGRTIPVRQEVGKQILNVLEESFARSLKELNLQITVQVKEFPRNLYFKIPGEV